MSFPLANIVPNGSIINLPDEILLQISNHLLVEPRFDRSAYRDLTSLAAANTRFPRVIRTTFQELKALSVPLPKVYALFRTLRDFPAAQWTDKIESLEITNYVSPEARKADYGGEDDGCMSAPWSSGRERRIQRMLRAGLLTHGDTQRQSKTPSRQFNIETDILFRTDCLNAIQQADDVSNRNKRVWEDALRAGHNNAFLALLLLILPNLEELLLGGGHIFHYPMVLRDADPWQGPMGQRVDGRCHWSDDTSTQQLRKHKCLAQVFEEKYSRLTKLEMPSSWSGITLSRVTSDRLQPRYWHFDDLRSLILPESALLNTPFVRAHGMVFSALPVTLRSLTIVDYMCFSTKFVQSMLHSQVVVATNHLPDLRSIDLYYCHPRTGSFMGIGSFMTLSAIDHAQATGLGIQITEHHPQHPWTASDAGGQPWKLSRNELDDMARLPLRDRTVREVAGHWVGKKQGKGHSVGSAKEHFRKHRG